MTSSRSWAPDSTRRYVAVIPARSGSRGIPNKTLAPLAGLPLLHYSVQAATKASGIVRVFVSTEDEDIAAQARASGAEVVHRPAWLSEDDVAMDGVLLHAIGELRDRIPFGFEEQEWMVLLQPTSPLRTHADIDAAITHLEATGGRGLVSVTEQDPEVYKFMTVGKDGFLHGMVSPHAPFMRRQDCPTVVRPNGAIYIYQVAAFLEAEGFYFEGVVPFVMPPERSVDIDGLEDLALAERLLAS